MSFAIISLVIRLYFPTNLKQRELPADFPLSDIGKKIAFSQNIGRIVVFIFPIFLPLKLGTMWFHVGLPNLSIGNSDVHDCLGEYDNNRRID